MSFTDSVQRVPGPYKTPSLSGSGTILRSRNSYAGRETPVMYTQYETPKRHSVRSADLAPLMEFRYQSFAKQRAHAQNQSTPPRQKRSHYALYAQRSVIALGVSTFVTTVLLVAAAFFWRAWLTSLGRIIRFESARSAYSSMFSINFARLLAILVCTLSVFILLRVTEQIMCFNPKYAPSTLPRLASLRIFFSSRQNALHVVVCIAACVIQTIFSSTLFGNAHADRQHSRFSNQTLVDLSFYTWLGAFSGLFFSILSQTTANNVWRFSPTKTTMLSRARRQLPWILWLSLVQCVYACVMSYMAATSMRFMAWWLRTTLDTHESGTVSFMTKLSAISAASVTLFSWNFALMTFKLIMTISVDVRRQLPEDGNADSAIARDNAKGEALVFEQMLSALTQKSSADPGRLSFMLGLLYFRDIALSSAKGRRAIFVDATGRTWNNFFYTSIEPVDNLAERLSLANTSRVPEKTVLASRRQRVHHGQSTTWRLLGEEWRKSKEPLMFGEGMCVVWACEAISHLLVASREEDDFGLAQRTLVHTIMSLLRCKEQLDLYMRVLKGKVEDEDAGNVIPQSSEVQDALAAIANNIPAQTWFFSDEVMGGAISDALGLALYRLVDAFRQHLQGYIAGSEPHWDRRLDRALQSCLEMEHT